MEIIRNIDRGQWWSVAEDCSYATFFHTPLWNDLALVKDEALVDQTIAARLSNGTTVVLPLIGITPGGKRVGRRLRSTYAGSYGGVIADGPLTTEISELYEEACDWRTVECKVSDNPLISEKIGPSELEQFNPATDFTQIISLDRPFDDIFSEFSKDRRYGFRKSKEKGVTVRETTDLSDFREYFEAYQDSLERWEEVSYEYGWDFFEEVQYLSEEYPDTVKLWVTDVEGSVASGAIIFYWNGHAAYWHAASDSDYFSYYINDRIQVDIIEDAVNRGLDYYDLLPSGGNSGVVKFKSQFGPERQEIQRWTYESAAFKYASKMKNYI